MLDFANTGVVKGKMEELKQTLDSFNEIHSAYHSQLTKECDIIESEEYSRAVNQSVTDLASDIANWVMSKEFTLPPPRVHVSNRLSLKILLATSAQGYPVFQRTV